MLNFFYKLLGLKLLGLLGVIPRIENLGEIKNILILCKGNICRSPYAKIRMVEELKSRGVVDVTVNSAGLDTTPGKQVDATAQEVSVLRGLDLSNEKTSTISEKMISDADLIFVMEPSQKFQLVRFYPAARSKTFCLGALSFKQSKKISISDPFGLSKEYFQKCFDQIDGAIAEIICNLISSNSKYGNCKVHHSFLEP